MEREKEEKMEAKNTGWMIVIGGMVGAMLAAGVAVAAPGGQPVCESKLKTCNADLQTCQVELASCQTFPGDGVDARR